MTTPSNLSSIAAVVHGVVVTLDAAPEPLR
jgi:hypothetical protein